MPKIKTKRSAAKRFKRTAGGKITHHKANARHILTKKTSKRKRGLRQDGVVDDANRRGLKKMLPYL